MQLEKIMEVVKALENSEAVLLSKSLLYHSISMTINSRQDTHKTHTHTRVPARTSLLKTLKSKQKKVTKKKHRNL